MSKHTTLKTLFAALHGCLPYEYNERYVNVGNTDCLITINKKGSERTIYITTTAPEDNGIFNADLYDDAYDDEPIETSQLDTTDPDYNLIDLIAYIEKNL